MNSCPPTDPLPTAAAGAATRPCPASPARRRLLRSALGLVAGTALSGCDAPRAAADGVRVIETRETRFGRLSVVEIGRRRYLAYGSGFERQFMYESALDLDRPLELAAPYNRLMTLGAVYAAGCGRMLQIGVGAGNLVGYALRNFPEMRIDAVDIDAQALELGARHFGLAPHPRLALHVADGRAWLEAQAEARFDIAMLDAYDDRSIPAALAGADFYTLVASRLADGGVAMQNVYLPKVDVPALLAAVRAVFGRVDLYRLGDSAVLAACREDAAPAEAALLARAQALDAALALPHPLAALLQYRVSAL